MKSIRDILRNKGHPTPQPYKIESSTRSQGGVFNQTTTYSGDEFEEKSFKIEVPAHQWGDTAFEQLTVVMHSAAIGFWHNDFTYAEYSTPLKVNWV